MSIRAPPKIRRAVSHAVRRRDRTALHGHIDHRGNTAIVGLAGAAPSTPSSCAPSRPVALLHLHGTADATIAYDGGPVALGSYAPGAIASVAQWAGYLGCAGQRTDGAMLDLVSDLPGAETTTSTTAGCPAGGAADLWSIAGGSHLPIFGTGWQPALFTWLDAHVRP
jgi:polyhydroxybutyrate depolymerase